MFHASHQEHAVADLESQGVDPEEAAPAFFRLLWRRGVKLPPPHFLSFWRLTLVMGAPFALGMAPFVFASLALVWFLAGEPSGVTAVAAGAAVSVASGVLFGLHMAVHYRHEARNLSLPSWERYVATLGPPPSKALH